jgi:hypothetical protein
MSIRNGRKTKDRDMKVKNFGILAVLGIARLAVKVLIINCNMKRYLFIMFLTTISFSCNDAAKNADVYFLDIENADIRSDVKLSSLDEIRGDYKIIPLETNDSVLLSSISINAVTNKYLVIESDHVLYFFNRSDGKIHSKISNKGNGPNQYLAIYDVEIVEKSEEAYLYDGMKKVLSKYNFDGKFISSEKNDFIGGFSMPDDTTFLVSYSPFVYKGYDIGVYNSKWQLLNQYSKKTQSDGKSYSL